MNQTNQSFSSEVTWSDLCLKTVTGKRILKNASGQISPGSFTAILGPSGSGKTTLLDCISGRIPTNLILSGSIKINGQDRNLLTWPRTVSYVGQKFPAYERQTVYETLSFVAAIKLKNEIQANEAVEEILSLLGMIDARDTRIASLSGGERVRVSLGIELLGNPSIILLDEPVSGLDSFNALNILEISRKIAKMGKTVLITIHQPSYKMSQFFDKIILMCDGSPVFDGTLDDCIAFFDDCGLKLPENTNPTDFFLDALAMDTRTPEAREESLERIGTVKRLWVEKMPEYQYNVTDPVVYSDTGNPGIVFSRLLNRSIIDSARDTPYVKGRIFQRIFVGLIFGLTFLRVGVLGSNVFTFRGVISFYAQNELFGVCTAIFNTFSEEKKIIDRERKSGLYTGYEAYFSKLLSEIGFTIMYTTPYVLATYYIVGLDSNFGTFVIFLLILLSIDVFSVSFGLTISTIAPTQAAAQVIGISILIVIFLYSGILGNPENIPVWLSWLKWLSPIYYGYTALIVNQLNGIDSVSDSSSSSTVQDTVTGPETLDGFGLNTLSTTANVFIILGYALAYQLLGAVVLHLRTVNNFKIRNPAEEV